MRKVMITGANGFVGQHLAKELAESGWRVLGVGGAQGLKDVPRYLDDYVVLDLGKQLETNKIDFKSIDAVIHLAGIAAVGPSFDNPMNYISTNIGIETNLFEAALAQKAKPRFLIVSSGSLYDAKAKLPLTELSPVAPSSPYAVSKIGQEQMAHYYGRRGFDCIIARPFNHIGPGQNEGFIVPDITKQVIDYENGRVKEVVVGNLDAKRDYTDVRDIARAYRMLIEKGRAGETYNICSGKSRSGQEILDLILESSGSHPPVRSDPSKLRPSDSPELYGSHEKISTHTGWQPKIELRSTIQDAVEDRRSRG